MKITAQEEYGLRCLMRLARADDGQSLTIPEVAAAEGLSGPYVAKILAVMRQAGLIESERGRAGGYHLARPAADIHLGTVLMALSEPLFDEPSYCQKHKGSDTNGECVHIHGCSLRSLWLTLEQWMHDLLERISLADLLQSERDIAGLLRSRLAEMLLESSTPALTPLALAKD